MKPTEEQIKKKIEELYKRPEEDEHFAGLETERSGIEYNEEEEKEIAEAVRRAIDITEAKEAKKPKQVWKWRFWGRILFRVILYLIEFFLLFLVIKLLLPVAINNDVSIWRALNISAVLTFMRAWAIWKT
jgi:hypothetical protein